MRRLGIVIPYRDRQQHLTQAIPHLAAYFTCDKLDNVLQVHILVVEQSIGGPFNRGLIRNIGFKLLRNSIDYVCFHDIDYLPIWADYRYPNNPTMILWHGSEITAIEPGNPAKGCLFLNPAAHFGGVVLLRPEQVERVNGYATGYWGWGHEDRDFALRLEKAGYQFERRKGTFQQLPHRSDGFLGINRPSEDNVRNGALLESRWAKGGEWESDGLNTTAVAVIARERLTLPPDTRSDIVAERVLVHAEIPQRS